MLERLKNLFGRKNLPIDYYVYLYLRDNGIPYYVGKGTGVRAWVKHTRSNGTELRPDDSNRIEIVAHRLSETEALILENKLIKHYGFKFDNGMLVNLKTNQVIESVCSEHYKNQLKKIHNMPHVIENHRKAAHSMWADETIRANIVAGFDKDKRSNDTRDNWKNPEIRQKRLNGILTTTSTQEYKDKRAARTGLKAPRVDRTIYNFVHTSGIEETCTRIELSNKYGLSSHKLRLIIKGIRKTHKGWKIK